MMTQSLANRDGRDLPMGVQLVLDNHSQIVQIISQMMPSTNNSLPQSDLDGRPAKDDVQATQRACERCGEIGHASNDYHGECPYCDVSHPVEECPMSQVTCFLCEGTTHIPAECKFYSTVQLINQQAKDRMSQPPERTPEDRRLKRKMEDKDMGIALNHTTKCCYSCEEEGHLSRNCSKKRECFPTTEVEYEENEVRDLLALESPKGRKDNSKVMCSKCKELGHYKRKMSCKIP
jgi:hypothetical protein